MAKCKSAGYAAGVGRGASMASSCFFFAFLARFFLRRRVFPYDPLKILPRLDRLSPLPIDVPLEVAGASKLSRRGHANQWRFQPGRGRARYIPAL